MIVRCGSTEPPRFGFEVKIADLSAQRLQGLRFGRMRFFIAIACIFNFVHRTYLADLSPALEGMLWSDHHNAGSGSIEH